MKNLILILLCLGWLSVSHAQPVPIASGTAFLSANARLAGINTVSNAPTTGFGLLSQDETTIWSIGGEGGYFLADNLAVVLGLGYIDFDGFSSLSYKIGAKYYLANLLPVQVDLTGSSIEDFEANPLYMGIQGGAAIFLNNAVAVEPTIRYNVNLNNDFDDSGFLEVLAGFTIFLGR